MDWFLLSVKLNEEQKVAEIFNKMDIEAFCPLIIKNIPHNTPGTSEKKGSYIFVKLEKKYRGIIFAVPDVLGYFISEGKPVLATEEEMKTIKSSHFYNIETLKWETSHLAS